MNRTYRNVTVLSVISALAAASVFSQALAQPSNPLAAIGAAGEAVVNKAGEALGAAGRSLTPPAYSPPAGVIPDNPVTGEPAFVYANPPYWYFDRPDAPLSPYAGQPAASLSPDAGQPYGYDPQLAAALQSHETRADAAQPAAPVTYATRPPRDANYANQALAREVHPCKPAIACW